MLYVGFGKKNISQIWEHQLKVADEISLKVCYMRYDKTDSLLVVMDLQGLWSSTCNNLRKKISNNFNIPISSIGIFTTQNHSTPYDNGKCFDYDFITKSSFEAVKDAIENAVEVEIAFLEAQPEKPLVFKRRKYFENMGGFTYWFGYDQTPRGPILKSLIEKSFGSLLDGNQGQVRSQEQGSEIQDIINEEDYRVFEADDPMIQGVFFRDINKKPVGSLLRFGAHPATANKGDNDFTTADYPYYFRTAIEKEFGGEALFFTGPCGDQCPNIPAKSLELSKELGHAAANELIKKFGQFEWEPCNHFLATSPSIELNLKTECFIPTEELEETMNLKKEQFHMMAKGNTPSDEKLNTLKNLSDEIEIFRVILGNRSSNDIGIPNQASEDTGHQFDLTKIEINNLIICGIPGEPFGEYANKIRANVGDRRAFVIDEANGYLGYLPTEDEFGTGGYECNVALFDEDSERIITDAFKI
ncbi:MAG: hypothetical protein COA79_09725 [Planctomycetota bacterium]|nr:MAG: hypothetical protein COA79_09725 [Planctomycetota bacterium]